MFFKKKLEEIKADRMDEHYMKIAIKEARKAAKSHEVPIGCVIVHKGKIIGKGHNHRNGAHSSLAHAEIMAIQQANKKLKDWRLEDCTLYVTLEPCMMCAGAIVQSRIPRVVQGCMNPKAGCAGSIINILQMKEFMHQCEVTSGVCEEECSAMLTEFFKELRESKKKDGGQ